MNMRINQISTRNAISQNDSGDADFSALFNSSSKKPSQAPKAMDGNKNEDGIGRMLSDGMERFSNMFDKLFSKNQAGSVPKVDDKGKSGGCGSHQYSNDRSQDYNDHSSHSKPENTSHSKPKNTSHSENDDGRVGADKGDGTSNKSDPTSKINNQTSNKSGPTSKASGPSSMPQPTGTVTVNEPIVVKAGQVFDGGGKLYKAGSNLGDGGQSEHQKPVFIIEPGGVLKNLQYQGADGIHTMGDATIQNVWNRDVGEDAMTMKKPGHVTWSGGGAFNASDKIFQLNAGGSFTLENFTADNFGKAIRTNGGKNIDTDIVVRNSRFTNGDEAIVRTDATATTVTLDGVTFSNVPNDVLAPDGTKVVGAVKRSYKPYSG